MIKRNASRLPTAQQAAWHELEFGMFIHYGLYAFTGVFTGILWIREGSNPLYSNSLDPVNPELFNPTDLDAEQWVAVAKDAGMKYLVLTAKHHDGFCLWPTAAGEHSVKRSSWRRGEGDVVREVAEACRAQNIAFGIYLSPWDAYAYHTLKLTDSEYDEYYRRQLAELLTNYGKVSELWWDGAGSDLRRHDWNSYYDQAKSIQPDVVIAMSGPADIRWFWEMPEEQGTASDPNWYVVHVDNTMVNPDSILRHWSADLLGQNYWWPGEAYAPVDKFWSGETRLPFGHGKETVRTVDELLENYHGSVGRGSNLVINFVPEQSGRLSAVQTERISAMGSVLRSTYKENLLRKGQAHAAADNKKYAAACAIDGNPNTWWQAQEGLTEVALVVELGKPVTFDRVVLQEGIALGQRIQSYQLQTHTDEGWQTVSAGTSIGHKKIDVFQPVVSSKIRLELKTDVLPPTIREIGLYNGIADGNAVRT